MARDDAVDPQVRQKCKVLFVQWANEYKDTAGLQSIANLYKEFPKTGRPAAARQKVLEQTEPHDSDSEVPAVASSADHSRTPSNVQAQTVANPVQSRPVTLTPTHSSFSAKLAKTKNKLGGSSKSSGLAFNLGREKENMTNCIARSSIASTNLLNGLQLINRETERVSENPEVVNRFDICKTLRRQILMYIQNVESDEWIGSLVNANDELVKALTAYEIMDRSIEDDSDSDAWESAEAHAPTQHSRGVSSDTAAQLAGLRLAEGAAAAGPAKPPRPAMGGFTMPAKPSFPTAPAAKEEEEGAEEDEDNPFGDDNAAPTPAQERAGMTWRTV